MLSQIQGNIKDFAADATHELRLGMRRPLKMHTAHGAGPARERVVYLDDRLPDARTLEHIGRIQPAEKTPVIFDARALYEQDTGDRRRNEFAPRGRLTHCGGNARRSARV